MAESYMLERQGEQCAQMAETSVYSGLAKLFEINSVETVDVAERIVRQVVGYTADMALLDGSSEFRDLVLASLKRLRADTDSLIAHVEADDAATQTA